MACCWSRNPTRPARGGPPQLAQGTQRAGVDIRLHGPCGSSYPAIACCGRTRYSVASSRSVLPAAGSVRALGLRLSGWLSAASSLEGGVEMRLACRSPGNLCEGQAVQAGRPGHLSRSWGAYVLCLWLTLEALALESLDSAEEDGPSYIRRGAGHRRGRCVHDGWFTLYHGFGDDNTGLSLVHKR